MKPLGYVLVAVGVIALLYGGISYNKEHTVIDLGSIKATATEQKTFPISPIIGGIALLGGLYILIGPKKLPA